MVPSGVTRWPTRTPGSTVIVHERGRCSSATRRMFRAACSIARIRSRGALRLAARISARVIHSDFRVRRNPSRRNAQRNNAASPLLRTSARIRAAMRSAAASCELRRARNFAATASVSLSMRILIGHSLKQCLIFLLVVQASQTSTPSRPAAKQTAEKLGFGVILRFKSNAKIFADDFCGL